jgi:CheY-like chemotaxis protein
MTDPLLVLFVDDDRDTREMYEIGMEVEGVRLAAVGTAREALAAAVELVPRVIVTDLTLPDMDGVELCRRLASDERTQRIPILALTGRSQAEQLASASAAGARRVIVKPCAPDELAAAIREIVGSDG